MYNLDTIYSGLIIRKDNSFLFTKPQREDNYDYTVLELTNNNNQY